jgi:hypothetical protein
MRLTRKLLVHTILGGAAALLTLLVGFAGWRATRALRPRVPTSLLEEDATTILIFAISHIVNSFAAHAARRSRSQSNRLISVCPREFVCVGVERAS